MQTRGVNKYFIIFKDARTRDFYVCLLKSKYETIEKFALNKMEVGNQLNRKIKVVRSDQGSEYQGLFGEICILHGIIHEVILPYSPQTNAVVELKNQTLKEMINAMLVSYEFPLNIWGEAILIVNYLLNEVP